MGKIKKILENELVGGTQTTDVYPVTSVKAVYDENNERLDHILNRRGVVNISTNYNSDHIAEVFTLDQAIAKVPSQDRVLGFQGKYLASDSWHTIIYIGDSLTSWSNKTKWIDLADKVFNSISKNATFAGVATPDTNPGTPDGPVFYFATQPGSYVNFNGTILDSLGLTVFYNNGGNWHILKIYEVLQSSYGSSLLPVTQKAISEALIEITKSTIGINTDTNTDADLSIVDESGYILAQFKEGHIITKNFDSRNFKKIDIQDNVLVIE